jgi:ornithine decarboxylase
MEFADDTLIKTRKQKTPFLLSDLSAIERNYVRLQRALPGSKIFFAIKSNYDPELIGRLNSIGSCFDVASWTEIDLCLKKGVAPSRLLFSAPVKIASEIKKAYKSGVRMFVYDSLEELEKIAKHAPQSQVILRIYVESTDSKCPMFTRFGVASGDAVNYLLKAQELNLQPPGLTFHVGSQCTDAKSWQMALSITQEIWSNALDHQLQLELLDLGGGLPVPY